MKRSYQKQGSGLLTVCALVLSVLSGLGAERVAFVVGNDSYPTFPLDNAVRDATAVRDMLTKDLGFATEDVVFMTNGTRLALYEQFEMFKNKAAVATIVLVYYAGHGMESLDGTENFLLPVDADVTRALDSEAALRATGINLMTLAEELADVSEGAKIILLDACRERPKGRGLARSGGGLAIYADEQIPADTLMILAAGPTRVASDGDKHGPFTAALLEILPKPGQNLMAAFFAVSDRVQEVTQKQQVPWLKFDGSGSIFRKNSLSPGDPQEEPAGPGAPVHSLNRLTKADLLIEHTWINRQGKEINAIFGGLEGTGFDTFVLLNSKGNPGKVLMTSLSEESRLLARDLAAIQADNAVKSSPRTNQSDAFAVGSDGNLKSENTVALRFTFESQMPKGSLVNLVDTSGNPTGKRAVIRGFSVELDEQQGKILEARAVEILNLVFLPDGRGGEKVPVYQLEGTDPEIPY